MKALLLTATLLASLTTFATEITTADGMAKIKTNMENSKKNKEEFSRSVQVVASNLTQIKKNKDGLQQQKKTINTELAKTNEAYKKLNQQEREIATLIDSEKAKLQLEEKQMQMLSSQMEQLKKNQDARKAIIDDYQNQLNQAGARKNEWKQREQGLKSQEQQNNNSIKNVRTE
jgi:chromosome segregation ATPase